MEHPLNMTCAKYSLFQGADMKLFPRILKFAYYIMIVSAFCSNMIVVSHTTVLSVLGAGMALRGPDGSMMTATDGLYEERKSVFWIFGIGLGCTVGSVVIAVWIILQWESALCCMCISVMTCRIIWRNYKRVSQKFYFDENDTVDFRDIMEGPAAIQAIPMIRKVLSSTLGGGMKKSTKKSKSLPVVDNFDTDESDDSGWRQQTQQLTSRRMTQRRGRSASPPLDQFIQTV